MHLIPIIALLEKSGSSGLDEMLRLIGIAAIITAVFRGIKSLSGKGASPAVVPATPAAAAPPSQARTATPPVEAEGIAPEIVAVIAAAVASFSSRPHRIVSIKRQSTSWEKAGRQSVLTSHRIR